MSAAITIETVYCLVPTSGTFGGTCTTHCLTCIAGGQVRWVTQVTESGEEGSTGALDEEGAIGRMMVTSWSYVASACPFLDVGLSADALMR